MAPQRHVNCAEDVGVIIGANLAVKLQMLRREGGVSENREQDQALQTGNTLEICE